MGLGRYLIGTTQKIHVSVGVMGDKGRDDIFEGRLALFSRI
jgi:hypothetical protein